MSGRIDFTNEDHVKDLRRRIKVSYFLKTGRLSDWEDCAQSVICSFLENQSGKQTIDHAVIDYLRERSGKKTHKGYEARIALENSLAQNGGESLNRIKDANFIEFIHSKLSYEKLMAELEGRNRAVLKLYFEWGLTFKEIGDVFGISESRVSQLLADINRYIKKKLEINLQKYLKETK
jgi:RNA polymerase sigma factor (sigma-70 family)